MIRTLVTPHNQNISIVLPQNFVGKKVEIIAFTIEETKDDLLVKDSIKTYFASQQVLSKDWLTPEEDEAWQNL